MALTARRRKAAPKKPPRMELEVHTLGWVPGCPAGELHTFREPVTISDGSGWLKLWRDGAYLAAFKSEQVRYWRWRPAR